jgi:uroporphyrinogen decarboxylase
MKQLVKSTLAVVALATLASQAVSAQSSISKVNSRERILQVLDQSRPNDYVPAAFFLHF